MALMHEGLPCGLDLAQAVCIKHKGVEAQDASFADWLCHKGEDSYAMHNQGVATRRPVGDLPHNVRPLAAPWGTHTMPLLTASTHHIFVRHGVE